MVHALFSISSVVCLAHCASAATDTPVQKVLVMLGDMSVKNEKAVADEKKLYAQYSEFVDDESKRLAFEIETGKNNIDRFEALLAKADNDADNLSRHAEEIRDDIERIENSLQDAKDMRQEQKAGFRRVSQDYGQSMDALSRAIEAVKGQQNVDRPQVEMLLQKLSVDVPSVKDAVTGFVQESSGEEEDSAGDLADAGSPSESDGLLSMLYKLQDKFTEELHEVSTEESNRVQNYDVTVLHLRNSLKDSNGELGHKMAGKAKAKTDAAALHGKTAAARQELAADEKLLADMKASYEAKSAAFAENQKFRGEEIKVLKMATEIISSPSVASSYGAHVNLAQASFLQVGSSKARDARAERVAVYLQKQGAALSSSSLSSLAARIMRNPFYRVIHLIEALLSQMHLDSQQEADHKAWCDDQLHVIKQKSQRRTTQANQLSAEMAKLAGQMDEMAKAIEELTKEQSQLTKAMEAATDARQKEKAENEAAISDAQAGNAAVKRALVVLEEFYSAQAASFVQMMPATFHLYVGSGQDKVDNFASHRMYTASGGGGDSSGGSYGGSFGGSSGDSSGGPSWGSSGGGYVGASEASGGVIDMLEVIASDFVHVAAETNTAEHQAAVEYEAFMRDVKADSEAKHALQVKTKLDKDQAEFEKSQSEDDHDSTSEELAKAKDYLEELKSQCVGVKVNFKERAAARNAEIKALREAYKMLDAKDGVE